MRFVLGKAAVLQLPFFLEKTSPGLNFPQSSVVEAQTIQLTQTELQVVFRGKGGEATCFFLAIGKKNSMEPI